METEKTTEPGKHTNFSFDRTFLRPEKVLVSGVGGSSTSEQASSLPQSHSQPRLDYSTTSITERVENSDMASSQIPPVLEDSGAHLEFGQLALSSTPSCTSPSLAYVDASGLGLGLFYQDRWQAWELVEGWRIPSGVRDIQWAEAIGLELGLRQLIKEGHVGKALSFCSDNKEVVRVMSEQVTDHLQCGETVQHVQQLCREHNVQLQVTWTPTESNPADKPSRMKSDMDMTCRFPHDIDIPERLQELVHPFMYSGNPDHPRSL